MAPHKHLPSRTHESRPRFDQLDLIELAKVLHDFAVYWRSHNRHIAKATAK
jgi:hypothetical protein